MCNNRELFTDLVSQAESVTLGDGHKMEALGRGTVVLDLELPSGRTRRCHLADVLYVPDLAFSLVSVTKASDRIGSAVFTDEGCEFLDAGGKVVPTGRRVGQLYYLNCREQPVSANAAQQAA